eukprot:RCo029620
MLPRWFFAVRGFSSFKGSASLSGSAAVQEGNPRPSEGAGLSKLLKTMGQAKAELKPLVLSAPQGPEAAQQPLAPFEPLLNSAVPASCAPRVSLNELLAKPPPFDLVLAIGDDAGRRGSGS